MALKLPLFEPDAKNARVLAGHHPSRGNALVGRNPNEPDVVVSANGGSDLVYLPQGDKNSAARVVRAPKKQEYVTGLFVDDSLGKFPGTRPLSAINLKGSTITPLPAIVVIFRTYSTECNQPTTIACLS